LRGNFCRYLSENSDKMPVFGVLTTL